MIFQIKYTILTASLVFGAGILLINTMTFAQTPAAPAPSEIAVASSGMSADFSKAIQVATSQGSGRYKEIVTALGKAGYILKPTSSPEVWIVTAPAIATTQPAVCIRLFPTDATEAQMRGYQSMIQAASSINLRMHFMLFSYASYPENERIPGTVPPPGKDPFNARELGEHLGRALMELPDIKTLAVPAPIPDNDRTRLLRAELVRLKQAKAKAEARRDTFLQDGDATSQVLRQRADRWDRLADTLGEAITDTERELRGELPPPPHPDPRGQAPGI